MEFLDEQGVEPCGHKARDKGMIIKVFTSCKSYEIPTEYRYSVRGTFNDKNKGEMSFWQQKQLIATQTTDSIDSSELNCNSKTIGEPCTLQRGYTWRKFRAEDSIRLVTGKNHGRSVWWYILLEDDDVIQKNYEAALARGGTVNLSNYGLIIAYGRGKNLPMMSQIRLIKSTLLGFSNYYQHNNYI